jgi:thiamine pyrophosphate-dependent acetolactate synthase large subunit-like protein
MKSAAGSGTDIAAIGRAAGIAAAERVADPNALATALARTLREDGPFLIVADVEPDDPKTATQARAMPFDIVEAAIRFRRALEDRGLVPTIWAV